jgi:peptide/nickel transport system substrate-binding protein
MMLQIKSTAISMLAGAAILASTSAGHAQKAKDTVTMAFLEATQSVDPYLDPKPENEFMSTAVFDNLIHYDEKNYRYAPLLAKSWTQVDPKTIEFELRDDVKWHDGQTFDADDAVYTLNYLIDPAVKLRFKNNWAFMAKVEKLGPYKIRVTTKEAIPNVIENFAYTTVMFPEHAHKPLEDKNAFGTKPTGTGMYKVLSVDRNSGFALQKNPAYKHGGAAKPASNVGKLNILPIPDFGTQTAQFMVGNVNLLRNMPLEQAEELAKNPAYTLTLAQSLSYVYMSLDAAGRSGLKPLQDVRVRKALMMAVNREEVYKIRTGNRPLPRGVPDALCWKFQIGCGYTVALPKYDPDGAKKLLAEAGYANGFDIVLSTFNSTKDMAEVVSGHLRKIGVRASVEGLTFAAYRSKQADGKFNALVSGWSAGGQPDVSNTLDFFFEPGAKDMFHDTELQKLRQIGLTEIDEAKRKAAVTKLMDLATERAYAIPVAPIPLVFMHSSDIVISGNSFAAFGIMPSYINWK